MLVGPKNPDLLRKDHRENNKIQIRSPGCHGKRVVAEQEVDKLSLDLHSLGISQMPPNMLDRKYSRWRINGAERGQRWEN